MNRPSFAILAALAFAAIFTGAAAQSRPDSPIFKDAKPATCAECGVVRSVKRIESVSPITASERKDTAGLVATLPFGESKPTVGSSTAAREELKPPVVSYEVVVKLDDGRFQVVMQDDADDIREGDKVKIERGKVVPRDR